RASIHRVVSRFRRGLPCRAPRLRRASLFDASLLHALYDYHDGNLGSRGVAQNLLHELHDRRESAERDHNQRPKADGKPQALRVYFAMELGDTATKLATKLGDSATELGLKPLLRGQQIGLSGKLCHDEISGCLRVRLGVVLGHAAFAQPSRISQTV